MEITPEHKERLDALAKAYVNEFHKDMQVPIYQGPNFTWAKFPAMVGRIVYASAFLSFTDEEFQPHYKDYAQQKAIKYAEEYNEDNS